MEEELKHRQSLEIINEMIVRARHNVQKGSANSMIFNGYAVAIIALLNYALIQVLPDERRNCSFFVWTLMIPAAVVDYFIKRKVVRKAMVKTQIDGIITQLWRGFGVSTYILCVLLLTLTVMITPWFSFLFTPVIMLFVAIVEFGMSKATSFRPFFWGAVWFWLGATLCLLSYVLLRSGDLHFVILAVCMVLGFIVPGYILNSKAKDNV
jgi:hypothetical protein